METNQNDFDDIFMNLLNPVDYNPAVDDREKLPGISYFGISTGASNLFFSMSKQSIFNEEADTEIKQEYVPDSIHDSQGEVEQRQVDCSPVLMKEEPNDSPVIHSPTSKKEMKVKNAKKRKLEKSKKKNNAKKTKMSKATIAITNKNKRSNYCFDIHRTYCPNTNQEKFYCNVSLQGKFQETVDLIKGKRGKYAYTFFDKRKNRKERRYWPSQSCGPVSEDNCDCDSCKIHKIHSIETLRDANINHLIHPEQDNNVIFLEDVFIDM